MKEKSTKHIFKIILFLIIGFTLSGNSDIHFSSKSITDYYLDGQKITLLINNNKIGYLSYSKIPLLQWYIMYDFFIKKEYRNKGYGKLLFKKVLQIIQDKGASKIFIQPGPFELINGHFVALTGTEQEIKIKQLVQFYQSFNFSLVHSNFFSIALSAIYKLLGIQEDSTYIMIHTKT